MAGEKAKAGAGDTDDDDDDDDDDDGKINKVDDYSMPSFPRKDGSKPPTPPLTTPTHSAGPGDKVPMVGGGGDASSKLLLKNRSAV